MQKMIRVIISTILLSLCACDSQTNTEADVTIQNIDTNAAQSLAAAQQQTVVILDVRTAEEYDLSHIDGAVNIDISDATFSEKVAKLDRDKTYIVHCAANVPNGRTAKSLVIMESLGFDQLLNLEGGIVAWEQAGQPLVKELVIN